MNAKFIAMLLSFFVISLPVHSKDTPSTPTPIPIPISKAAVLSNKIDLNKVDVDILTGSFKGIGKKRAEAIVAYREEHKGFKSIEELAEVKGIGQHFIDMHLLELQEIYTLSN